jgi:hypothetical protein
MPGAAGQTGVGGASAGVGLVGAGGAFMSVPFMTWCNVPIRQAVGTSAALGFPIALANMLGYLIAGRGLAPALPGAFGYLYLPALAIIASGQHDDGTAGRQGGARHRHGQAQAAVRAAAVRPGGLHGHPGPGRLTRVRLQRLEARCWPA